MKTVMSYAVARRVGMPVVIDERVGDPVWQSGVLRVSPTQQDGIVHEIAHFLIARSRGQLDRYNFGLSDPVRDSRSTFEDYLGHDVVRETEEQADELERHLKAVIDAVMREMRVMSGGSEG